MRQTKEQKQIQARAVNIAARPENNFIELFGSPYEFLKALEERPQNGACKDRPDSIYGTEEFTGTSSYARACEFMKKGYLEGCKDLTPARTAGGAGTVGTVNKRQITRGVAGCVPCVPLALKNVPANMMTVRRNPAAGRVVDIYFNVAIAWYIDKEEIIAVFRRFVSAIQKIELDGIRVNLLAGCVVNDSNYNKFGFFIKAKEASAPLNLLQLSYFLIHPSFYRRHAFKWIETLPLSISKSNGLMKVYGYMLNNFCNNRHIFDPKRLKPGAILLDFYAIRHETETEIYNRIVGKE